MAVLTYTVLRILLVVAAGALLWAVDFRGWLLLPVAVLIGAGLSYVLLDGPRRRAAQALELRAAGRRTRFEDSVAREDAEEDAQADALEERQRASAAPPASISPGTPAEPTSAEDEDEAEHRTER